jgi:hypothetical protein
MKGNTVILSEAQPTWLNIRREASSRDREAMPEEHTAETPIAIAVEKHYSAKRGM